MKSFTDFLVQKGPIAESFLGRLFGGGKPKLVSGEPQPDAWGPITAHAYNQAYTKLIRAYGSRPNAHQMAHEQAVREAEADLQTRDKMAHYRKAASGRVDPNNPVFDTEFGQGDPSSGR